MTGEFSETPCNALQRLCNGLNSGKLRHSDFSDLKIRFLICVHAHRQGNESTLLQKRDGLNADCRKRDSVVFSCNFYENTRFPLTQIVVDFISGVLPQNARHYHFIAVCSDVNL